MIINRSFKDFKFRHRSKQNQIIFTSKKVQKDVEVINLIDNESDKFKEYINKQNTNNKNTLLKSYDFYLNEKYNVVLNQKTIERVKNFFQ